MRTGCRLIGVGIACVVCVLATAQPRPVEDGGQVELEPMSLVITGAERGAIVVGDLRLPRSARTPMAAVLILHSSPGFDGRGAFYAQALNRAGIATLEVDYLGGRGLPLTPRDNLPHVFQTLRYMASHPRLDPGRVGVLGFSWGGILSLLASSAELARQHHTGMPFAAHVGLYPICWRHHAIAIGRSKWFSPEVYKRFTGSPILILSGGKDVYENDAQSCQKFVSALPEGERAAFTVVTYPAATFGWDSLFGSASTDAGVNRGRGGILTIVADPETSRHSLKAVVDFFVETLPASTR